MPYLTCTGMRKEASTLERCSTHEKTGRCCAKLRSGVLSGDGSTECVRWVRACVLVASLNLLF